MLLGIMLIAYTVAPEAAAQTFTPRPRLFQVGPNPCAIAAQDLNDDTWPEIITADRGALVDPREERPANDELSLLIAQGNLEYVKLHPSLKTDFAPYALAVANVDGLKWPDIIVANFHPKRNQDVSAFLNLKSEGVFKPLSFRVPDEGLQYFRYEDGDGTPMFTKPGLTALVVRDVNGDGLRDLVAAGWASDVLVIMPGHTENCFDTATTFKAPGAPRDLQLADFDKDGCLDIAVAMSATNEVALWKGDGKGAFSEAGRFATRGRQPTRIRLADLNRDGVTDIAVSHRYADDSIVLFYGDGGFRFSVSQEIMLGESHEVLEHEIRDFLAEDLNGDGRTDLAAACFASGKVIALINESADKSPQQSFRRETYSFQGGRPAALCSADFDQNGSTDLAVALWELNSVGLLMGRK
jgi:hypothetical protein